MKSFKLFCPVIICALLSSNCKKDKTPPPDNPYGLPNATQNGDYGGAMMACRINDVNKVASQNVSAWMSPERDTFNIFGGIVHSYFQTLVLSSVTKQRQINLPYSFSDSTTTNFRYLTDSTCLGGSGKVTTVSKANGFITFSKIDTVNHIVSGVFNCKIPVPNCDTINVTYGRFDITYQ